MRCWITVPLLLLAALACGRLVAGDPSQDGGIQGTVRDNAGVPVSNAKVTLNSGSAPISPGHGMTSANGRYEIRPLLPGAYVVCVEAGGYEPSQRNGVVVNADAVTVADFTLAPAATSSTKGGSSSAESVVSACSEGFNDDSEMKAAEFTGSVDPGGYSASAATQTKSSLLEGAANLRNQATWTAHDESSVAPSDLIVSSTLRETQLKRLEEADPKGFKANHELGGVYFDAGMSASAIPFLETARRANSADYDNDYTLARAYWESQKLQDARGLIVEMMALHDTAELHNLLAQIEGSQGNRSVALKEYERAFQMEPVEENRYDLGLELLLEGDIASAAKLFKEGVTRNPQSAKSWIGLGIALYSGGHSEDAVSAFLSAIDLHPGDPRPYLFLGKAYNISNIATALVSTRMNQWIQLEPGNAQAYYYYALSLCRGNRDAGLDQDMGRIELLFKESARLDPSFPFAHLQLGNLYFGEDRILEAIAEYQDAVRLKPELAEAHYHLGQAFLRTDRKELGQQQMAIFKQLREKQSALAQQVEGRQFAESIRVRGHTKLVPP